MKVNEIFSSFQGEGANVGKPVTFLRLAYCNLHCKWCDTPYAWNFSETEKTKFGLPAFKVEDEMIEMTVEELKTSLEGEKHLVITGGEPLIQQQQIAELINSLDSLETVEIETNGTIVPEDYLLGIDKPEIIINCSPKLESSGNLPIRHNPKALRKISLYPRSIFKFVVTTEKDLEEIKAIAAEADIPASKMFLMAEGASKAEQEENQRRTSDLALQEGWNFTPRLHILLFDKKRKV